MKQKSVDMLKEAVSKYILVKNERNLMNILEILCNSYVWVPCTAVFSKADTEAVERMLDELDGDYRQLGGKTLITRDQVRLIPDILQSGDDFFFPIFTSAEEMGEYGNNFSKIEKHILEVIPLARNNDKNVKGIVLDAFSEPFFLPTEMFDVVEGWNSGEKI